MLVKKLVVGPVRELLLCYGKVKVNVLIQKQAMRTCGSKFGKSCSCQRREREIGCHGASISLSQKAMKKADALTMGTVGLR